jgi:transposase
MIQGSEIIPKIMKFLEMFMCKTLVKRIVSMVLLSVGVADDKVTEITGLCNKSVRTLKKAMKNGETDKLFKVGGGGRKRKLKDVEAAVVEEIERNNYHSKQQIADMIAEKYGIKISVYTVSSLLKKTGLSV